MLREVSWTQRILSGSLGAPYTVIDSRYANTSSSLVSNELLFLPGRFLFLFFPMICFHFNARKNNGRDNGSHSKDEQNF